jgi:hypothetical protein
MTSWFEFSERRGGGGVRGRCVPGNAKDVPISNGPDLRDTQTRHVANKHGQSYRGDLSCSFTKSLNVGGMGIMEKDGAGHDGCAKKREVRGRGVDRRRCWVGLGWAYLFSLPDM